MAAIASSFSANVPLSETVAIDFGRGAIGLGIGSP
jgi:hypothetical protein